MICRQCGCTDDDPCMVSPEVLPGVAGEAVPCSWVAPGLCSACAGPDDQVDAADVAPEPLLYDAQGLPLVWR